MRHGVFSIRLPTNADPFHDLQIPCLSRLLRNFHRHLSSRMFYAIRDSMRQFTETRARCGFQAYLQSPGCTISWHGPVNGMHSIENRCTYKRAIFIDVKNRRSKKILVL